MVLINFNKSNGRKVMAKWFKTGKDGVDQAKREDEEAKQRRASSGGPSRLWLKPDSSAKVVFLDTPKFFFHEHNLKLNNKWGNYFTCLKDFDTCPICESGEHSSYCLVGTVIDTRQWEDKDGNSHKNEKRLFVAKGKARQRLLKQIERRDGDLRLAVLECSRGTGSTESSVGEDYEFLGKLPVAKVKKLLPAGEKASEFFKPFNYEELFKPKSKEELRKLMGAPDPVGANDDDALSEDDLLKDTDSAEADDILGDDDSKEEKVATVDDDDDVSIDELFN